MAWSVDMRVTHTYRDGSRASTTSARRAPVAGPPQLSCAPGPPAGSQWTAHYSNRAQLDDHATTVAPRSDSAECAAEHAGHVVTMVEVERQSCERPEALGSAALSNSFT